MNRRTQLHLLSKLSLILSSFELLGITLVPLCTAQLKASCVAEMLTDFAISRVHGH